MMSMRHFIKSQVHENVSLTFTTPYENIYQQIKGHQSFIQIIWLCFPKILIQNTTDAVSHTGSHIKREVVNPGYVFTIQRRHNERDGVSTVCTDADQRKHLSFALLGFVRGIHRSPVNSPHKGPVTRKMFLFDDVIMIRISWMLL